MDLIVDAPFIVRVLGTLFIIIIINRLAKNLAVAALSGSLILALWCGHSLAAAAHITLMKVSSQGTIFLFIIVIQVVTLSSQMSESGLMSELVHAIVQKIPRRFSIAVLPAVIGLLPMPGGAIFSAPLVDAVDHDKTVAPILKTEINYWFRHVWEYWWPLYPGVLLALDLTGLSLHHFIMIQFPLCIAAIGFGYFFFLRKIPHGNDRPVRENTEPGKNLVILLMPVIIIVAVFIVISIFFPGLAKISKYLPIMAGILLAQIILHIMRPISLPVWKKIIFSKGLIKLLVLVASVLIYGAFIEATLPDGTSLVTQLRQEFLSAGIPIVLLIVLLPFLTGLTTGIAVGFVGASFPIVISLAGAGAGFHEIMTITVLAFASGYMGMMLSPVHICLIVTNEHFKTNLDRSIVNLIPPAAGVMSVALIMYGILRMVLL